MSTIVVSICLLFFVVFCNGEETCFHTATNRNGVCLPLIDCPYAFEGVLKQVHPQVCRLGQTSPIVCCPNNETITTTTRRTTFSSGISSIRCRLYAEQVKRDVCPIKLGKSELRKTEVSPEEFPHVASIVYESSRNGERSYKCFGSLISEQFVVSAAHCFQKNLTPKEVHFGVSKVGTSLDDGPNVQAIKIREVIQHPRYIRSSYYNDIALVKLDKKVQFTRYALPICLGDDANWENEEVAIAGFLNLEESKGRTYHLEKSPVEWVNKTVCRMQYDTLNAGRLIEQGISPDTQICAIAENGSLFVVGCPLQMKRSDADCMYNLIGFPSFGPSTGTLIPDVFTRILPYINWIQEIVWPLTFPGDSGEEFNNTEETCFHTTTNRNGVCLPLIDCPYAFKGVLNQVHPQVCRLGQTSPIVCCPNNETVTTTTRRTTFSTTTSSLMCRDYAQQVKRDVCPIKLGKSELRKTEVNPEEFPHVASIVYESNGEKNYKCFGSLISDQFVVGPAHCFQKDLNPKEVHFGVSKVGSSVDDGPNVQAIKIREVIKHPRYIRSSYYNDIALVRLDKKVQFTRYALPICLGDDANWENEEVAIAGFSDLKQSKGSTRHLEKSPVEWVNSTVCRMQYDHLSTAGRLIEQGISPDTQICAIVEDGSLFSSGCPLQMKSSDADCMYTLIGFPSFGLNNRTSIPDVFTRMQPYRNWIEEIVWPLRIR